MVDDATFTKMNPNYANDYDDDEDDDQAKFSEVPEELL